MEVLELLVGQDQDRGGRAEDACRDEAADGGLEEPILHSIDRYLVGSTLVGVGEVHEEASFGWVYRFEGKGTEHRWYEAVVVVLLHSDLAAALEGCYYGFPWQPICLNNLK
jgi:hypothetical protein